MKKESSPPKKKNSTPGATDTATVEEAIRPYAIADKLRTLRLRRSMGLAQLAEHSGFSPAMLSRLENGGSFGVQVVRGLCGIGGLRENRVGLG